MIIKGTQKNKNKDKAQKQTAIFSFADNGKVISLSSDQNYEVIENLAKRTYLDEGMKVTTISFKTAFMFLSLGEIIEVNSRSFFIPNNSTGNKFIITDLGVEVDNLKFFINVTAKRWDDA